MTGGEAEPKLHPCLCAGTLHPSRLLAFFFVEPRPACKHLMRVQLLASWLRTTRGARPRHRFQPKLSGHSRLDHFSGCGLAMDVPAHHARARVGIACCSNPCSNAFHPSSLTRAARHSVPPRSKQPSLNAPSELSTAHVVRKVVSPEVYASTVSQCDAFRRADMNGGAKWGGFFGDRDCPHILLNCTSETTPRLLPLQHSIRTVRCA